MSRAGIDTRWTAAELAEVRRLYPTTPVAAIAAALGRSADGVRHAAKRLGVWTARMWSPAEDAVLRAGWGNRRTGDVARELGRSPSALKQRAGKLGLAADRQYTPADLALVRELYPTHTAAQIAERVHGTPRAAGAVFRLAHRLGLRKWPHWGPEVLDRVRALHAEGLPDRAIAERLAGTVAPGQKGHWQVKEIRRNRLGLPTIPDIEGKRQAVKTQFARLGIASGGELRGLAYRKFAAANGWPEDLRPREVQILNVLAEHGPKTRLELAGLIGMRTDRRDRPGHLALLTGNGPGGTYTASLLRRGLVARQARFTSGRGKGMNRLPDLYLLTPHAITIREDCLERAQRARDERDGGAAPRAADPAAGAG